VLYVLFCAQLFPFLEILLENSR